MIIGLDTTFLVQYDVSGAEHHDWARRTLGQSVLGKGDAVALCPQVLAEYLHVVTDEKRFARPLAMNDALQRAGTWWNLTQAHRVLPDQQSTELFLEWMHRHRLGRKRILDTLLAATYASHGIRTILSTDLGGFHVFGEIDVLHP